MACPPPAKWPPPPEWPPPPPAPEWPPPPPPPEWPPPPPPEWACAYVKAGAPATATHSSRAPTVRISVLALFTLITPLQWPRYSKGPPATGLDASRARLFKPTHIKTQSRTGALTAIAERAPFPRQSAPQRTIFSAT